MSLKLEEVVPWGRSLWEYTHMFDLDEAALASRICGVGDGPASFNAELTARGGRVVSCDPIYTFTAEQIRSRVEATHDRMVANAREHQDLFNWWHLASPEEMGRARLAAMARFLEDFPAGVQQGRYVTASLPGLPFADDSFDLALCSHFLFLYTDHFSVDFHVQSIIEMTRIAREARIFPLLMLGNVPSTHLAPVRQALGRLRCRHELRTVPYEFQKGGDQLLVVTRA
jgi:hypothetical protein